MLGAWLLTCLVVSTYFTSLIVAALTVRTSFAKIDSVEDLVRQPQIHPMYPAGTQLGVVLQTSISEGYGYLYKHSSVIDVVDLYRPKDIDAILNHKAVLMIGKDSAKYRLKEICPKVDGRFYISTGNVYVWNSIFVAHKDFPQDLFKELNKR
ncbi:hypothetical protein HPB48_015132 [Haemaphysalis longicornis]|uniref:Uncharacterized protein n=1 Tax=Haemaphysalis longicornis TaxID=44386 RepID=A0A9J6GIH8_HAELO|nr:hypothetical protein HPB48_015132 [Haemaphysalis longicornis]